MEEKILFQKILEIINKLDYCLYEGVKEDLHIGCKGKERAVKEIDILTHNHYMKFINDLLMLKIYDWDWGNDMNAKKIHHFLNGKEVTFKEVYQYWLDNVKNK